MTQKNRFIFAEGPWQGTGSISFSMTPETLEFTTDWRIISQEDDKLSCIQEILIDGVTEKMVNHFTFSEIKNDSFIVELKNEVIGCVKGKGVIDAKVVAWEFRDKTVNFEGLEVYEMQEDGTYKLKAEYISPDQLRTMISGSIGIAQTSAEGQ